MAVESLASIKRSSSLSPLALTPCIGRIAPQPSSSPLVTWHLTPSNPSLSGRRSLATHVLLGRSNANRRCQHRVEAVSDRHTDDIG